MKLNSKLTGGLAWAGLVLVLAVPSADFLTKGSGNAAQTATSDMDAVETATVAPAAVETAAPRVILARPGTEPVVVGDRADPVETYINSGKTLPSYISDAPAAVASTEPAAVQKLVVPGATLTVSPAEEPIEVASVDTDTPVMNATLLAPVPYPASMRPRPGVAPATTLPATSVAAEEEPLILDEDVVARREAAVAAVLEDDPYGPEVYGPRTYGPAPAIVTGDELEEWDSGSLAEYLERRNLLSDGDRAGRSESGFFLDELDDGGDRDDRRRPLRDFLFF